MTEIRILDSQLINKIAAGEVVERPAAVVKELAENAVDAKATSVSVDISNGGASLIRVADNGTGIAAGQLKTAFMRHATSKITDLESLENVLTLGFRGEALSSIAGVAQVEMVTKTPDADIGAKIVIHGGQVVDECEHACKGGTVFTVRNLFYNTPARRKFLKSTAQESAAIAEVVHKMALSRPDIAFKYTNNNTLLLQTNGQGLDAAVFMVYGKEAASKMLHVGGSRNGFSLTGLAAAPELNRSNRQYCNFFINGRYIKSPLLQQAAEEAYKTRLPIGRFPVFALSIALPPDNIDINVHPSKMEVRFADERFIYDFVRDTLSSALGGEILIAKPVIAKSDTTKPDAAKPDTTKSTTTTETKRIQMQALVQAENLPPLHNIPERKSRTLLSVAEGGSAKYIATDRTKRMPPVSYIDAPERTEKPKAADKAEPKAQSAGEERPFFYNYVIVGQAFATYWIIEQNESLYMLDQHAAHERVLFEEITGKLKNSETIRQMLATPFAIRLTPVEMAAVSENKELLEKLGFELEAFGEDTYALRAVPYILKNPAEFSFFNEIIDILVKNRDADIYSERIDDIAMVACKAAIKGNDRLDRLAAKALIDKVLKLENPFTCPHGRPTIIEITKHEIEKMFKRV